MNGWRGEMVLVALLTIACVVVGILLDRLTLILLIAIALYLGWHLLQLARLIHRSATGHLEKPDPGGVWGDVWQILRRAQRGQTKARKHLSRFDARFREVAAVFPDALVVMSRSTRVRWCNPKAEDMLFDATLDQVAGGKLDELVDQPRLKAYLGAARFERALILDIPHLGHRVLSLRIMPFGRKKHQLLLIASDITRVYHLDVARRDFVANVSHELRTPLTVITGYLDPLSEHLNGDAEWSHSLQLMQQQADRMRQMINDLTLLSRLESEEKPRRDEMIDVGSLLNEIVSESQALAVAADHDIKVELEQNLRLRGDRVEIRSAISNLVLNALRHTPGGTLVTLSWHRRDTDAALSVADNGPGIAADHLPRLTERFYRVDPGRSRSAGGTGLGLAIVKHVLSRHDAQLAIDSEPGRGSVFVCEFPVSRLGYSDIPHTGQSSP